MSVVPWAVLSKEQVKAWLMECATEEMFRRRHVRRQARRQELRVEMVVLHLSLLVQCKLVRSLSCRGLNRLCKHTLWWVLRLLLRLR